MTSLDKPVTRRTRGAYPVLFRQPRQVVVSLAPGDLLVFREAGRRASWSIPIDSAFKYAVRVKAFADAAEKRRNRLAMGKGVRK